MTLEARPSCYDCDWMSAPSYDDETLAGYFHPVLPSTWADPIVGPALRHLAETAPDVIAAVADVDRSLIADALSKTPEARLHRALELAAFIERTRAAAGGG